jgi:ZIP family zinc transporter
MYEWFTSLGPVVQALLATLFTWGLTALGAATVFPFRDVPQKVLDALFGFAGGVMLAASYFSLLAPAVSMAERSGGAPAWLQATGGFLAGGVFLWGADKLLPHLHSYRERDEAEGVPTQWRRSVLLVLAITLHNLPEGLAVGVAFGAAATFPDAHISEAIALALGIGLQNFPEGVAVAMPLRREGYGRLKSFWYGQLSAVVEPIGGVAGAAFVLAARPALPFALSFAAGAMVYVVVEEVIPAAQEHGHDDLVTNALMVGFAVMMSLDVGLA